MARHTKEELAEIAKGIVLKIYGQPIKRTRGRIDYLKLYNLMEIGEDGKATKSLLFKHQKNLELTEKLWTEQGKRWKMRIDHYDCDMLYEDEDWLKEAPIEDMTEKEFRKYVKEHRFSYHKEETK